MYSLVPRPSSLADFCMGMRLKVMLRKREMLYMNYYWGQWLVLLRVLQVGCQLKNANAELSGKLKQQWSN